MTDQGRDSPHTPRLPRARPSPYLVGEIPTHRRQQVTVDIHHQVQGAIGDIQMRDARQKIVPNEETHKHKIVNDAFQFKPRGDVRQRRRRRREGGFLGARLVCLEVSACRAKDSISRQAKGAPGGRCRGDGRLVCLEVRACRARGSISRRASTCAATVARACAAFMSISRRRKCWLSIFRRREISKSSKSSDVQ